MRKITKVTITVLVLTNVLAVIGLLKLHNDQEQNNNIIVDMNDITYAINKSGNFKDSYLIDGKTYVVRVDQVDAKDLKNFN